MSETFKKLRKKRGTPMELDGDTFYVRDLTLGELRRVDALAKEDKTGFVIGCALCTGVDGGPEIPQQEGETDSNWSKRVAKELEDVPTDKIRELCEGASKSVKVPKTADIVKN